MNKTCFVIQGFGEKTDFETGRKLNLDASYEVIKEAVEAAGLDCIRADEVQHSGFIDKPMYEMILNADLVIADLSTSNVNAFYELGVRHALRPYTTIIVAESEFTKAFDISRNLIRTYKHLGEDIGRIEAKRFSNELEEAITEILKDINIDSPLYTFLPELQSPIKKSVSGLKNIAGQVPADEDGSESMFELLKKFRLAKKVSDWSNVIVQLLAIRNLKPNDVYATQQLALATYKSDENSVDSLIAAKEILISLDPGNTHDAETLGLWGAIHKRLWMETQENIHLDEAIKAYQRGYFFSHDYYNGINYAYLLNVRGSIVSERAEAITDWIEAGRVRRDVIDICENKLNELSINDSDLDNKKYWILATQWEAYIGLGQEEEAAIKMKEAIKCAEEKWMSETSEVQITSLRELIKVSPLQYINYTD